MADDKDKRPIIIKKIKKAAHGHHGGAWKVAYADFVTAMMAFFLLQWLLATASPQQKAAIADYFTPTVGMKDQEGIGFKGGQSASEDGIRRSDKTPSSIVVGKIAGGPVPEEPTATPPDPSTEAASEAKTTKEIEENQEKPANLGEAMVNSENTEAAKKAAQDYDDARFKEVESEIKKALESDPALKEFKENVITTMTPEGLRIDMVDDAQKSMFALGSAILTDEGKRVLTAMSGIVVKGQNQIAIGGHTDAKPYPPGATYTNWELSSDRANAARRFLLSAQVEPERVKKVAGMAEVELLLPQEPNSPRNRRISITLLRGAHMKQQQINPTGKGILTVPEVDAKTFNAAR